MKTKEPAPAGKAAAQQTPRHDLGSAAVLYRGGFTDQPNKETGPCVRFCEGAYEFKTFANHAQRLAADATDGTAFQETCPTYFDSGLVLAFASCELTDAEFLCFAAIGEHLTFEQAVTAKKNLRWVGVFDLHGDEFLAYARRVIRLAKPRAVVIWPVEYFLGSMKNARDRLLTGTGWLLPMPAKEPGPYRDSYGYNEGDD